MFYLLVPPPLKLCKTMETNKEQFMPLTGWLLFLRKGLKVEDSTNVGNLNILSGSEKFPSDLLVNISRREFLVSCVPINSLG